RNPLLSFVAVLPNQENKIIGTSLCGHDGRRGYLYHVVVSDLYRNRGIGKSLVAKSLSGLKEQGIHKCHLFVYAKNELGKQFWTSTGWTLRKDIVIMSKHTTDKLEQRKFD
ncbi:MAG: GNAT family N-acetyltransferase, partial [Bacillales bacterium]